MPSTAFHLEYSMFRTSGFFALVALASTLAMSSLPAQGANITVTDSSCGSFTATPDGQGNIAIVCGNGGSGVPSGCSVTGPTTGSVGQSITLGVSCTSGGAPTGWQWGGGHCAGVATATCAGTESSAGAVTYTVIPSNSSGAGAQVSKQVTWSVGAVAPSGCSLTPATTNLPAGGGSVTLTANCTGGTVPITHTLAGGAFNNMSAQQTTLGVGVQFTANVSASSTISGTASNGGGSTSDGSASITVGGGGGGGYANCTAQGFTAVGTQTLTWGQSVQLTQSGPNPGQVWVLAITPPIGTVASNNLGAIQAAEYGGNSITKQMTLSTTPCDFATPLKQSNGTTTRMYYDVVGRGGMMTPGTTYYISIRNWSLDFNNWSCDSTCGTAVMLNTAPN
jgi:hypothetical protein